MTSGRSTLNRDQIAAVAMALVLAALCGAAVGPSYVNHDAAWYLYVAKRWFDGATLYRSVIDTNPPLIIWLTAIPVWWSNLIGAAAPAVFKVFVFAAAGLSLFAVYRTVTRAWPHRTFVLLASAAFVSLPFVKSDFGQREHVALLLTLPYIFAAAAEEKPNPNWLRWTMGIGAGLGFSIKPHFYVAWLSVEAAVALTRGVRALRRPELFGAIGAAAIYAAALVLLTPDYLHVANQVRQVYGGLNSPLSVLLRLREFQLWLVGALIVAAIRWRAEERLVLVLFAAATGYLVAALLQLKGWGYQLYPARALLVVFLAAAAAALLDALPGLTALLRGGRRGLGVVFAAALTVASVRYIAEARRPVAADLVTPLIDAIASRAPAGPLTVLSMRTIIYPAFPAVNYSNASWGMRHNSLWFLPGFYDDQDRQPGGAFTPHALDTMPAMERMFFDQVVDDLCASPPGLLAIERTAPSSPAGRRALDLETYYGQSPRAKRLLQAYRPDGSVGPFTLLVPATAAKCE